MLRALRHRDFALLWVGQAVSLVGDGVYLVAIAWLVYDLSNAPGALALVGFAWTLPQVATLLVAGVLSDRLLAPATTRRSATSANGFAGSGLAGPWTPSRHGTLRGVRGTPARHAG
jgi:MFS family permease